MKLFSAEGVRQRSQSHRVHAAAVDGEVMSVAHRAHSEAEDQERLELLDKFLTRT